ncbi:hypothetical protein BDF21DRAFT_463838 [Thamnidium elegans]|uniref:C2H2-type domain-containing protein n=1 Tax=Thamnidium elegans TaxID=101142 RepID=A0A8H7W0W6_9FUNG|nr:hypothetical protein INT48_003626 [Thamnidium elegans]KAI8078616.1 hypothetical protein BDF21DRAFT_463838 [Thamnidium elegans]
MVYSREKIIVNIIYPCYICAVEFGSAKEVMGHIYHVHGYFLNPRPAGRSRPLERRYSFEKRVLGDWDIQHFACPSCWFHCVTDIEMLMQHIMEIHDPPRIEGFVHPASDEEEEYELVESSEEENSNNNQEEKSDDEEVVGSRQQLGNDIMTTMEKLNDTFKKFFS